MGVSLERGVKKPQNEKVDDVHGMPKHLMTYGETLMNLFKGMCGAGLFAMGDAFRNGGIIVAPVLTVVLGAIAIHCEHLLVQCSWKAREKLNTPNYFDYPETAQRCFEVGPLIFRKFAGFMRNIIQILVCVTQLGFCCIYFVFITENMEQLFHHYGLNWDSSVIMALMLLPIIIPSLITNLKYLAPVSMLANICLSIGLVVTMVCAFKDGLPSPSERHYYTNGSQMALYFGTVLFSFEGIALVLPLRNSMKKPEKFSGPLGVLNVGMAVIAFLFTFTGFFGYLKWGEEVAGSLTLNVPIDTWYGQLVKISASLGVFFGYPLQFYVPVKIMWPGVKKVFKVQKHPLIGEIIFRACLVVCTFGIAEAVPKLGLFISLIGSLCSTALALIIPSLLELIMKSDTPKGPGKSIFIKNSLIILLGFLGTVTGTYQSFSDIIAEFFS